MINQVSSLFPAVPRRIVQRISSVSHRLLVMRLILSSVEQTSKMLPPRAVSHVLPAVVTSVPMAKAVLRIPFAANSERMQFPHQHLLLLRSPHRIPSTVVDPSTMLPRSVTFHAPAVRQMNVPGIYSALRARRVAIRVHFSVDPRGKMQQLPARNHVRAA